MISTVPDRFIISLQFRAYHSAESTIAEQGEELTDEKKAQQEVDRLGHRLPSICTLRDRLMTIVSSIEEDGKLIPAALSINFRDEVDPMAPFWKNVTTVVIVPLKSDETDVESITFTPEGDTFFKVVSHSPASGKGRLEVRGSWPEHKAEFKSLAPTPTSDKTERSFTVLPSEEKRSDDLGYYLAA